MKVGIPVCLHDSNPEEPSSLYLRSGLCFTCQRILNEKRRTQRKKKSSTNPPTPAHSGPQPIGGMGHSGLDPTSYSQPQKRFRLNGEILDLNPDAIIINGPLNDTKVGHYQQKVGCMVHNITFMTIILITSLILIFYCYTASRAWIRVS